MRNKILAVAAIAILVAAGGAFILLSGNEDVNENENTITDLAGREVKCPEEVKRVATLGPGALRMYSYAGDIDLVVGIEDNETEWEDYWGRPYMLANEDKLTSLEQRIGEGGPQSIPDKELLLTAKLDVLFISLGLEVGALDQLQKDIRAPVIKIETGDNPPFDDALYRSMEIIGEVIGTQDRAVSAETFIKGVQSDLKERTKNISEEDRVTAYVGGLSFRGQQGILSTTAEYSLFDALNVTNIYEEYVKSEGKTVPGTTHTIDFEVLTTMDPGIIIMDEGSFEGIKADYDKNSIKYNNLDAFKNDKVFVQARSNWYANNIDVILLNGYYMGINLYPNEFENVSLEDKFSEIMEALYGTAPPYESFKIEGRNCFETWNKLT